MHFLYGDFREECVAIDCLSLTGCARFSFFALSSYAGPSRSHDLAVREHDESGLGLRFEVIEQCGSHHVAIFTFFDVQKFGKKILKIMVIFKEQISLG